MSSPHESTDNAANTWPSELSPRDRQNLWRMLSSLEFDGDDYLSSLIRGDITNRVKGGVRDAPELLLYGLLQFVMPRAKDPQSMQMSYELTFPVRCVAPVDMTETKSPNIPVGDSITQETYFVDQSGEGFEVVRLIHVSEGSPQELYLMRRHFVADQAATHPPTEYTRYEEWAGWPFREGEVNVDHAVFVTCSHV